MGHLLDGRRMLWLIIPDDERTDGFSKGLRYAFAVSRVPIVEIAVPISHMILVGLEERALVSDGHAAFFHVSSRSQPEIVRLLLRVMMIGLTLIGRVVG